ncbi:MAG: VIT family protein [Acidobacteria bacterium]|nr:VIT family protein [Acidobacteriota bacterium]
MPKHLFRIFALHKFPGFGSIVFRGRICRRNYERRYKNKEQCKNGRSHIWSGCFRACGRIYPKKYYLIFCFSQLCDKDLALRCRQVTVGKEHYVNRVGWLRAAVLGANDGIISTSSLVIGVAAASSTRSPIVLAALAGLTAGAMSMAAGEYVSVSSQGDAEQADLKRESEALLTSSDLELKELSDIYVQRGLDETLAREVAAQLTKHNALEAHARDELGINEVSEARPLQAAAASFGSFLAGALLPLFVAIFAPLGYMVPAQYVFALVFLVLLGIMSAKTGGSPVGPAVTRIAFWGTVAMAASALVGYIFGVNAA